MRLFEPVIGGHGVAGPNGPQGQENSGDWRFRVALMDSFKQGTSARAISLPFAPERIPQELEGLWRCAERIAVVQTVSDVDGSIVVTD